MNKTGIIIVSCYLGLVIISLLWILYLMTADPLRAEFSAVPLVILTLPWSIIAIVIINQINPYLFDITPLIGIGIGISCAIINSMIIYLTFYLSAKKEGIKSL